MLYPGVFPNLAAYTKPRADLNAILLTGIPSGVVPGFQNFTGPVKADMLRLNVAIPPTGSRRTTSGLVAGDAAGFPNGRRLNDDVVTIELRAVGRPDHPAGRPVVHPGRCGQRRSPTGRRTPTRRLLGTFPYLGLPGGGYQTVPGHHAGVVTAHSHENPHAGQGAVLLDIGGDVGALVVTMPAAMVGEEVEVLDRTRGAQATTARTSRSCDRPVAGGQVPSLVFPELVEGSYGLCRRAPTTSVLRRRRLAGARSPPPTWPA